MADILQAQGIGATPQAPIPLGADPSLGGALLVKVVGSVPSSTPQPVLPPSVSGHLRFRLVAAASTNATSIKNAPGVVDALVLVNAAAAVRSVKLYDKAAAPVVGTDTPAFTFLLAAGQTLIVPPAVALNFTAGIALAITGAVGDADTTAVTAGDVIVQMQYQ